MRQNPQQNADPSAREPDGWSWVVAVAGHAAPPAPAAVPLGFAERVLALRAGRPAPLDRRLGERLVLCAAGLAIAATLLLAAWSWPELRIAWSYPAPPLDAVVSVEPSL